MRLIQQKPEEYLTSGFSIFEIDQWMLRAHVELDVRVGSHREVESHLRYEVTGGLLASQIKHHRSSLETHRQGEALKAIWRAGEEKAERSWSSPLWAPTEIWRAIELSWGSEGECFAFPTQFLGKSNEDLQTKMVVVRRDSESKARLGWESWPGSEDLAQAEFTERLATVAMPMGLRLGSGRLLEISASFLGVPALKLQRVSAR